jgi:hypothetical protein
VKPGGFLPHGRNPASVMGNKKIKDLKTRGMKKFVYNAFHFLSLGAAGGSRGWLCTRVSCEKRKRITYSISSESFSDEWGTINVCEITLNISDIAVKL